MQKIILNKKFGLDLKQNKIKNLNFSPYNISKINFIKIFFTFFENG